MIMPSAHDAMQWRAHCILQIKAPKITTFVFPKDAYISAVLIPVVCSPYLFQGTSSPLGSVADWTVSWIGTGAAAWIFWLLMGLHALEALYTASLCRRHSTGLVLGVSSTFCLST